MGAEARNYCLDREIINIQHVWCCLCCPPNLWELTRFNTISTTKKGIQPIFDDDPQGIFTYEKYIVNVDHVPTGNHDCLPYLYSYIMGSNRGIWLDWDTVWFWKMFPNIDWLKSPHFVDQNEMWNLVKSPLWLLLIRGFSEGNDEWLGNSVFLSWEKRRVQLHNFEEDWRIQLCPKISDHGMPQPVAPTQKAGAFWIKRYRSSSTWSSSAMLNVMTSTGVEITWLIGDLHLLIHLVGGIPTPLKNMSSSVGIIIPNWMEK